ncbi:MAG: hydrogenase maturation nickel metallochaperone HypA [Planctomycetota bacterium]
MHERTLVRALIAQVEELVAEPDCVTNITVSLGDFSGVDARLFALAFDELKPSTRLSEAALQIDEVDLEGRCETCGHEFAIQRYRFKCPVCGGTCIQVIRGEELTLESVVVEGALV